MKRLAAVAMLSFVAVFAGVFTLCQRVRADEYGMEDDFLTGRAWTVGT